MQHDFPAAFSERLRSELGKEEATQLLLSLAQTSPSVSRHWNPAKNPPASFAAPVPWYAQGEYLEQRPVFTLDPAFQAGAYYVQEAASMFIAWMAKRWLPAERPWRVLDLCAAPGGKSCLLAAAAPPGSLLVSNEVIKSRYPILRYNLSKWGLDHCYTANLDPERFTGLTGFFDLVLVDAPCSGEGLFRKDPAARQLWNPALVELCAARQSRILSAAHPLVKPNGLLIYSTCTFNSLENEAQATVLSELGFELLPALAPQRGSLGNLSWATVLPASGSR
ncbi:MAG: RsmB/NOP family class I SAM-dependent RNA methyltransferase [Lewinella sp.]|nr:RsmB/NOP family class I SAM-dependent RNA methyltransferase [Lewinella sp.]